MTYTVSSGMLNPSIPYPFPGEPGLAGFIEAENDGSGGDNWNY